MLKCLCVNLNFKTSKGFWNYVYVPIYLFYHEKNKLVYVQSATCIFISLLVQQHSTDLWSIIFQSMSVFYYLKDQRSWSPMFGNSSLLNRCKAVWGGYPPSSIFWTSGTVVLGEPCLHFPSTKREMWHQYVLYITLLNIHIQQCNNKLPFPIQGSGWWTFNTYISWSKTSNLTIINNPI